MVRSRKPVVDEDVIPAKDCKTGGTNPNGWCARPEGAPRPNPKKPGQLIRGQKHRHFADLDEANKFAVGVRRTREAHDHSLPDDYTVNDCLDEFIKAKIPEVVSGTISNIRERLAPVRAKFGPWSIWALQDTDVADLLQELLAAGCGADVVNQTRNRLGEALERLRNRGLSYNAAKMTARVKAPKQRKTLAQMRTGLPERRYIESEVRDLLAAADDMKNSPSPGMRPQFWFNFGALRRGESLAAEWANTTIDDEEAELVQLWVNQQRQRDKETKRVVVNDTKCDSDRLLTLPPLMTTMVREVYAWQREQVRAKRFPSIPTHIVVTTTVTKAGPPGSPYHPDSIYGPWKALCTRAKVRYLNPHRCRATTISLMAARHVDPRVIKAWVGHGIDGEQRGHSDVTEDHYTDIDYQRWHEGAEAWQDIFSEFVTTCDKPAVTKGGLRLVGA